MTTEPRPHCEAQTVICRNCGLPLTLYEQAFGSPATGYEHPFNTYPLPRKETT